MSLAGSAVALERNVSDVVLVDTGTVVDDDLYGAGNQVVILGRVNGDLVVTAFEEVVVAGTVTGDILGLAQRVVVEGEVGGSVRTLASEVVVTGTVGGDVTGAGLSFSLGGTIGGDVFVWSREAVVAGDLAGNVEGRIASLALGGSTGGNIDVTVDDLTVDTATIVDGDLGYRSAEEFPSVQNADVGGAIVHRTPLAPNIRIRALWIMVKLIGSLAAGITGLLVMWAAPDASRRARERAETAWWKSWSVGIVVMAAPLVLVAAAALFVASAPLQAALPAVGVMALPLLAIIGVISVAALMGPAAVYPRIGTPSGKERSPFKAFLLGLLIVTTAVLVPWLVVAVLALVVPTGIGAWLTSLRRPETT